MLKPLTAFFADDTGATAIEYAMIASLIALLIITAVTAIGTSLSTDFSNVTASIK